MITRYKCPVDGCDWQHDVNNEPVVLKMQDGWQVTPPAALMAEVEQKLAEHFEFHTPVDFLRTIQRLNQALAGTVAAMPNDAERVPLTYLLGQYDRLLAAHEHVVMDTPKDQARHRQVVETFRAAAEPIRRSIPGLGEVLRDHD